LWWSVPSVNETQQMQHFVVRFGFFSFITTGVVGVDDATETEEDSGLETAAEKQEEGEFTLGA
jgi:hypothetical protein